MKKRLLLTSATIAVGPLAFLSASCSNSKKEEKPKVETNVETSLTVTNKGWTNKLAAEQINPSLKQELKLAASNGLYTQYFNSSYSEGAYPFDSSMLSWTLSGTISESVFGKLLEYSYVGKAVYETKTKINGLNVEETTIILRPSIKKMQFDLADQILLWVDGNWKVYDNDDIDSVSNELNEDVTKGWKQSVVKGISSNVKSINSKEFMSDLAKATKLSFRIRPNQKWVDKNGNETKYKVVADDFRMSALRTLVYADASYRRSHGSSIETDKLISTQFNNAPTTFTNDEPSSFTNKYLFELFNVSFDDLVDPSKSVRVDEQGNSYFTFNVLDESRDPKFVEYLPKLLDDSSFIAAPSQYIIENASNKDVYQIQSKSAKVEDIKTTIANLPEGSVKESGLFWYGTSIDNTLFSSRYYSSGYNPNSLYVNYKVNTHYHDKEWVNASSTIKTFSEQYSQAPSDPSIWINTISNNFISGSSPTIRINELNSEAKKLAQDISYDYVQAGNKDSITRNTFWSLAPVPGADNSWLAYMQGNSVFYDVLYGYNVKELNNSKSVIRSEGTSSKTYVSVGDVLKQSTAGTGIEFKTILLSALNLGAIFNTINPDNPVKPWNNSFASASPINDKTSNTLLDYYDEVTKTFVVDSQTGERYRFNELNNQEFMRVDDNRTFGVENSKKYQSVIFDELSEKMTALLDRVYAEKGFTNEKVQITIPWRYSNMLATYIEANKGIVEVWNRLDKKGRLQIEFQETRLSDDQVRDKLYKFFAAYNSISPVLYSGWTYDYERIGSGFDGYNNAMKLHNLFALIATDNEYKTKLEKSFPELVKAGLAFVKYAKTKKLSIPVEVWPTLSLEDANNLGAYLGQYKYNPETKEFSLIPAAERNQYDSLNTISAEFWLNYQSNHLNDEQAVALVREIGNTQLPAFDGSGAVAGDKFIKRIVNPYYIIPATDGPMAVWNIKTNL
ncbi:OppA family ABC transporter substrate-binding lipoprotein [Mycoplasmopsis anatis]|uniref:Putative intrinsic membrane protein n=1 Tax=Mycoplasmopsis anatis 1340 TaxID=1034808 RepID=F9QEL5_9BACT|nr:hypothetical protein [Mycoplasmopsis anatis]EGS28805.1 putative intrinsic membrane protein [Mycoplasmopsis anatis 1340]